MDISPIAALPARPDSGDRSHAALLALAQQIAPPDANAPEKLSKAALDAALDAANAALRMSSQSLRFARDDSSGHVVVKLIDDVTNQVIKQFPSEQMLAIARDITHMQQGVLVSEKT